MTTFFTPDQRTLSPFFMNLLFCWFLCFGVVLIEPAPFDVLFFPISYWFLAQNKIYLPQRSPALFSFLALFAASNVLSVLAAVDPGRAGFYVSVTVYMLLFSVFISIAVSNFGLKLLDKIMAAYMIAAVVSSLVGIVAMMRLLPAGVVDLVTSYGATRARPFFKDPNVYAPFLLLPLVYALHHVLHDKARRLLWGAAVFVLMFGVLVGFSRAAWGASILAVFMYFVFSALAERRFTDLWRNLAILAVLVLVAGGLFVVFAREAKVADYIGQRLGMQDYDVDRFTVQRAAIMTGLESVIGIGPGQSEIAFEELVVRRTGSTHSLYIRVIAETGILGAITFFGVLLITIYKALRLSLFGVFTQRKIYCVFSASFFATLLNSFVIDSLHWRHFFFIIGVIWGFDVLDEWKKDVSRPHVSDA